jgi:hypothetical protein
MMMEMTDHHDDDDNGDLEDNMEMTTLEESDEHGDDDEEEGVRRSLLWSNEGIDFVEPTKGFARKKRLDTTTLSSTSPLSSLWQHHWLGTTTTNNAIDHNDDDEKPWIWYRHGPDQDGTLILDAILIKFFKFIMVAIGCLLLIHAYVWLVNDKRDVTYGLREMLLYDSNLIALDWIVWFVIGRMYQQASADTLEFVIPTLVSAVLQSFLATHVSSLQHSVTPLDMVCGWTWQMWTMVWLGAVPLLLMLGGAHVVTFYRQGQAIPKLIEVLTTLMVFLAPSIMMERQFFHLHHWYYAWLIGMHCNINTWWSRLGRNVMFGIYINGVAIFGRDPIMTCALSLYQSQSQKCYYIVSSDYVNYTLQELAHDSGMDVIFSPSNDGCNATTTSGA